MLPRGLEPFPPRALAAIPGGGSAPGGGTRGTGDILFFFFFFFPQRKSDMAVRVTPMRRFSANRCVHESVNKERKRMGKFSPLF